MLIDKFINTIYEKTKDIVLKDIKDEDKNEIANGYLNYLYELYSKKTIAYEKYDRFLNIVLDTEIRKWQGISSERKMQYLMHDNSLDVIYSISGKAYELAKEKYEKSLEYTVNKEEIEKDINTLINELKNVREFNKDIAKKFVSESIVDFEYASGNNKIISFRLSHIINKERNK